MILYNVFRPILYLMTTVIVASLMIISSAMAATGLNTAEAKALINDKTVESVGARGFAAVTFFSSDGVYKKSSRGDLEKGVWHINEDGQLCQRPDDESTASCQLIVKKGNVWKLYKIPSKVTKPWKHKRTFNKILDGNTNNL